MESDPHPESARLGPRLDPRRNLRLINYFSFFSNGFFLIPIALLFYRQRLNLDYQALLLTEAVYSAIIILCDVPTGWLSDIWRRKHTLALGAAMNTIGFVIYMLAHRLWHVLCAELFIGMGISLISGAKAAMLYDSLLSLGREDEYRRREGSQQAMGLYAVAISCALGGWLYSVGMKLPFLACLVAQIIGLACALAMHEPDRHKRIEAKHPVRDIIDTVTYALHGHKLIGFVIIAAAFLFSATKLIMWGQQPYYMALNLPAPLYGLLIACGAALGGLSSHCAHLLDNRAKIMPVFAAVWIGVLLVCLGAGLYLGYAGIALLMLGGTCGYGIVSPRVNEVINRHVDAARRATVLSTGTFLASLFFIPLSSLIGLVSARWGVQASFLALAAWLGVIGLALAALAKKRSA
jgi:MFS family permease